MMMGGVMILYGSDVHCAVYYTIYMKFTKSNCIYFYVLYNRKIKKKKKRNIYAIFCCFLCFVFFACILYFLLLVFAIRFFIFKWTYKNRGFEILNLLRNFMRNSWHSFYLFILEFYCITPILLQELHSANRDRKSALQTISIQFVHTRFFDARLSLLETKHIHMNEIQ